jgi:peptidoglycan/LPS O-acetylase OafA/YrhL
MKCLSVKAGLSARVCSSDGPAHLFELDVLRGFLSWWVVVCHAMWLAGCTIDTLGPIGKLAMDGFAAVDGFIILSGFVITKLIAEKREPYGVFISRRILRLFPIFLVALVVAIFVRPLIAFTLANAKLVPIYYDGFWRDEQAHFWPQFFAHLTMLHGVLPNSILPHAAVALLVPAWSLSLEFQYYLVAPLFDFINRRFGTVGWFLLIAGSIAANRAYIQTIGPQYDHASILFAKLPLFFVGMTSYWIYCDLSKKHERACSALLFAGAPLFGYLTNSLPLTIWLSVFALIIAKDENCDVAWLKRSLAWPPLAFLGRISYATYLVHFPLQWIAKSAITRFSPEMSRTGQIFGILAISAPLTIVASALLYRFVEKPGIEFGRRLFLGPQAKVPYSRTICTCRHESREPGAVLVACQGLGRTCKKISQSHSWSNETNLR